MFIHGHLEKKRMHKTDVQRYGEDFVHCAFFTGNLINNCMKQKKSLCNYFDNLCSWNTSSPPVRSHPHYRSAPSPLAVTNVLMMIYKHLYT